MAMEMSFSSMSVGARSGRNISELERWVSMTAGAGLALYGLSRRRGNGWILAALGGLLFRRGFAGHCVTYELFDINTSGSTSETRSALGGSAGSARRSWRCSRGCSRVAHGGNPCIERQQHGSFRAAAGRSSLIQHKPRVESARNSSSGLFARS